MLFCKNNKNLQINPEPITNSFLQKNNFKIIVESKNKPSFLLIKPNILTTTTNKKQSNQSVNFESNCSHKFLSKTISCENHFLVSNSCRLLQQESYQTPTKTASKESLNNCTNLKRTKQQQRFARFRSITKPELYIERISNFRLLNLKCHTHLNSSKTKTRTQQKRFSTIELKSKFNNKHKDFMLSLHSATWTIVLVQLVLSAAALIASVSIVSAQAQSISRFGVPQKPSPTMIIICILCFGLMLSSICAMFGLSTRKFSMLLPLICISLTISIFHAFNTIQLVTNWWAPPPPREKHDYSYSESTDFSTVVSALIIQSATIGTLYLEIKCYRHN